MHFSLTTFLRSINSSSVRKARTSGLPSLNHGEYIKFLLHYNNNNNKEFFLQRDISETDLQPLLIDNNSREVLKDNDKHNK